jgi:predicted small lipoprotein YifL
MLKNIAVLVIFISYLALMGCGTRGPLYIPEQRYPQGAENNHAPKDLKHHATEFKHSSAGLQANIHAPSRLALEGFSPVASIYKE